MENKGIRDRGEFVVEKFSTRWTEKKDFAYFTSHLRRIKVLELSDVTINIERCRYGGDRVVPRGECQGLPRRPISPGMRIRIGACDVAAI